MRHFLSSNVTYHRVLDSLASEVIHLDVVYIKILEFSNNEWNDFTLNEVGKVSEQFSAVCLIYLELKD